MNKTGTSQKGGNKIKMQIADYEGAWLVLDTDILTTAQVMKFAEVIQPEEWKRFEEMGKRKNQI